MKLRQFLKYNVRETDLSEFKFLELLPPKLKNSLVGRMHRNKVKKINFFENKEKKFLNFIGPKLKYLRLREGDKIFKSGEIAESMYFISEGKVGYLLSKEKTSNFVEIEKGNT
jgi:CRP-like cAMP-binding protein